MIARGHREGREDIEPSYDILQLKVGSKDGDYDELREPT